MNYVIQRPSTTEAPEMRAIYGELLADFASRDDKIVVLDADLMRANGTFAYKERFRERWIDVGVAEANMIGISAGLSTTGMIPFPRDLHLLRRPTGIRSVLHLRQLRETECETHGNGPGSVGRVQRRNAHVIRGHRADAHDPGDW
jgi:hypothetical protein